MAKSTKGMLPHKQVFLNTILEPDWNYQLIFIIFLSWTTVRNAFALREQSCTFPYRKTDEVHPPRLLSLCSSQAKCSQGQSINFPITSKAWKHSTHILQRPLLYELLMNSILSSPVCLIHKEKILPSIKRRWFPPGKASSMFYRAGKMRESVNDGIHKMVVILLFHTFQRHSVGDGVLKDRGAQPLQSPCIIFQVLGRVCRA